MDIKHEINDRLSGGTLIPVLLDGIAYTGTLENLTD